MPKDRVCANTPALPAITRRSALAAPLVLLPRNTFASGAAAGGESPILRLFHEYETRCEILNSGRLADEVAEDRLWDKMQIIREKIMALPSISAADFAAKVIVDSSRAAMFSDWDSGPLWIEARELTGCRV